MSEDIKQPVLSQEHLTAAVHAAYAELGHAQGTQGSRAFLAGVRWRSKQPTPAQSVNAELLHQHVEQCVQMTRGLVQQAYNDVPSVKLSNALGNALQEWVKVAALLPAIQRAKAAEAGPVAEQSSADVIAAAEQRGQYCDGTGDVHTPTGEWRGECDCGAAQQPPAPTLTPERVRELVTRIECNATGGRHGGKTILLGSDAYALDLDGLQQFARLVRAEGKQ